MSKLMPGEKWIDEDAGLLVRPYAISRGRTRSTEYDLDLVTLVVSVEPAVHAASVEREYADVLWTCAKPLSIAEVAARVRLPLGVVKVLLGDLIECGYVVHRSGWQPTKNPVHDIATIQRVLDGIRKL